MKTSSAAIFCFTVGAAAFCFTAWEAFTHAPADQVPVVLSELGIMAGAGRLLVAGPSGTRDRESYDPSPRNRVQLPADSSEDSPMTRSNDEPE